MLEWRGVLIFWTRMTAKFTTLVKVTKTNKKKEKTMIATVAEKSVNWMSRVVVNIHGAFYVNLADNKHKHKHNIVKAQHFDES